jgi:ankyrin repeat domain-containing protein 50
MADPLSVAAGVVGLVSFGLQTVEFLFKFYTTYRDRDSNLARTANRLSSLLQSLRTVDNVVASRKWRPDEKNILDNFERSLSQCEDVIHELENEVQKLKKEPADTWIKTVSAAGRRAAYPFRQSTLKKLEEDGDEFGHNLSVALEALQLKEHQNTQDDIADLKTILTNLQAYHLSTEVREWLKARDATIDYNAACAKRHAGTGEWFVNSAAFTSWLRQDNSFLWLFGFAGCGKSILISTVIQHTFRYQRSQSDRALAFFFFTFTDDSKQDTSALLRAILQQLSGQVKGLDTQLTRLKESTNHGTPPDSTLVEYLKHAISRSGDVYLLIDALDESPAEQTRDGVLAVIQTMRRWALPGLHLLVTSRDILDIREALAATDDETVELKNDEISRDISRYVSDQVETDPKLLRWGEHREMIKQQLSQRAKGV